MSAHVILDPRHQKLIDDLVESGRFSSREDVISESLSLLEKKERKAAELKRIIEEGLRSAEEGPLLSEEEAFAPAFERLSTTRT